MCRRVCLPRGLLALFALAPLACAHEEWNSLLIVHSARSGFTYPFDGRSPKIAVALLNHHEVPALATVFTFTVNGQRMEGGGFTTFPNGGPIAADADNHGIASALTVAAPRYCWPATLSPTSRDATLLLSLPPGNYTAQVRATASSTPATGNALVEVYEVP